MESHGRVVKHLGLVVLRYGVRLLAELTKLSGVNPAFKIGFCVSLMVRIQHKALSLKYIGTVIPEHVKEPRLHVE